MRPRSMRVLITLGCSSVGNAETSDSNRRRTSKSPGDLPEDTRVREAMESVLGSICQRVNVDISFVNRSLET